MNRQLLRKQAREETKMQKWFNGFTSQQVRFHKELVRKIVQDSQEKTELILDSCYIAAMIEHSEMNLKDCIEIAKLANANMEETSQYLNREKEYYNMINDEKLRSQIREEAKMIIKGNKKINNLEIIRELEKEHKLPKKDLQIICKEAREELEKEVLKEIENLIAEPKENIPYTVTEKEIEKDREKFKATVDSAGITINGVFKESKLEIIEQTIKVKGEYGTYIKDSQGVSNGDKNFKDITEVEEYKKAVQGEYNKGTEELNKKFNELQEEMKNFDKRANKNFAIIEEIGQVFNM